MSTVIVGLQLSYADDSVGDFKTGYTMTYPLHLLHIIGSMEPTSGGPCQGIRTLSSPLGHAGVSIEVVCLDDPDASYLGTDSFPVHALGTSRNKWCYSPKLVQWLLENMHRFNVVITHGLWLYPSYASMKAIAQYKELCSLTNALAWYVMPHGMLDPYFQRASDRRLKSIRNWLYWQLIENKVVNQADGMLFTCETELRLARTSFSHYRPKRELNVGFGIEPPEEYTVAMQAAFRRQCPTLNEAPFWLFLSRIHPKKGLDLLLKAYLALSQEVSGTHQALPKLVIAGPGLESAYGKDLLHTIQHEPLLAANVCCPGMLTGNAKWGAFYGCEAFVLPSRQENFGIAVVEAMACGKPVLVSNQVNIWPEIETHGGGLIADDTVAGTERLLRQWLNKTTAEQQAMGRQAKATYDHCFAARQSAQHFKDVISTATLTAPIPCA